MDLINMTKKLKPIRLCYLSKYLWCNLRKGMN